MKIISAFLLLVLMLVCNACHQNNETPIQSDFISNEILTEDETYYENVYRPINVYSDNVFTGDIQITESEILVSYWEVRPTRREFQIYDRDGQFLREEITPSLYGYTNLICLENGQFLANSYKYTNDSMCQSIVLLDGDGTVIAQSEYFNVPDLSSDFLFYADDCILYQSDYTLWFFESPTAVPMVYELPCDISQMARLEDGTFLIYGGRESFGTLSTFYCFDLESGSCEEYIDPTTGKRPRDLFLDATLEERAIVQYYDVQLIYCDGEYYANTEDGLMVYRDGAVKEIINWSNSCIDRDSITIKNIVSDDCILVDAVNLLNESHDIQLLVKTEERRTKPREVVRIATIGMDQFFRELLSAAVIQFNRNNFDYKVELTDYYDAYDQSVHGIMRTADQDAFRQAKFEEDLLSGITYDAYFFPKQSKNRDLLADKGLLADLTPYLDEDAIFSCVEGAYRTGDGIVAMPFVMELSTLITNQDNLSSETKLTREVLYDVAAKLGDDETLFAVNPYENLKTIGLFDFLDIEGKTCSYDTDAFAEYVDFLADVKEGNYTDDTYERVHAINQPERIYYTPVVEFALTSGDALEDGKQNCVKFYEFDLNAVDAIYAMLLNFKGQDINYCGYPSDEGTAVLLDAEMLLSLSSLAASPDGVGAFMNFLLSDEIQASKRVAEGGLPVSRTAMEKVFPVGYIYYFPQIDVGNEKSDWYSTHKKALTLSYHYYSERQEGYFQDLITFLQVTEDDRDKFIRFLDSAVMKTNSDKVLSDIISEELSYTESGERSAAETGKILQSRIYIYINE